MAHTNYQEQNAFTPKLVLVEDERIVARDIETTLESLGYSILANVSSGEEAIDQVPKLKPDLLLMDIRLCGEIDGIDAVAEIHKSFDCPVIYLSAYSDDQTMLRARSTSPFGYLVKPFKSPELRCAIEIALNKHKTEISLQQQGQWLSSTLRSVADGVIAADTEQKIKFLNPVAENLTGYSEEDLLGQTIEHVLKIFRQENDVLYNKKTVHKCTELNEWPITCPPTEGFLVSKPGDVIPVEHTAAKVLDEKGELLGGVMTIRNIAERRKHHDAITRLNSQLESKVKERTAQLEVANKQLESFSYSVAHDLRAPLRAILGYSRMLVDDHYINADASLMLDKIQAAARRMSQLIDDLLRLSGIGKTTLCHRRNDLSSIVQNIVDNLKTENPDRDVEFALERNIYADCDASLMKIVFENLIRNAWKFTKHQTHPKIEFGKIIKSDDNVFYIKDNGVGFDMEYAGKLFTPFQRLHSADEFEGTGIGLAIVHSVIHRHGGHIWVDSKLNNGTTFYFTLSNQHLINS